MNRSETTTPGADIRSTTNQVGIIDILLILATYKRRIIAAPVLAAAVTAAVTSFLTPAYTSSVKLLPPSQSQSNASALLSQLGGAAGAAAGLAGLRSSNDLYLGMLKSRTVADRLIERFKLATVYEASTQDAARSALASHTVFSSGKDGFIVVEVEDENRKLAANIANAYVEELSRLTNVMAVTEAGQRRMFFERQLEQAKNKLAQSELALKRGIETRGVVSVDKESEALVGTLAKLRAQMSAKEIELNAMRAFVTEQNPQFKRTEEDLRSLRGQLAKLENGVVQGSASESRRDNAENGLDSIKLLRDVKYYQMLYELLAKQYEASRLEEARDPTVVQVLDPAVEAEKKSKPRSVLLVMLGAAAGLGIGICSAFIAEAKRRYLLSSEQSRHWTELKSRLMSW